MDEEWDTDNFEVKEPVAISANKWEGEDEDDEVKDSWDAEEEEEDEEEKKDIEKPEPKKKPKKSLLEKLAEKEKQRLEEIERKLKEKEEEEEITPEERLRRQKESDLELALETTFGSESVQNAGSIDCMNPQTKEEFLEFSELLNKKISTLTKSAEFPAFAEDHIRNLCATLSSLDIKKLKTTIDNMFIEKQKVEKGDKTKKNKGKAKAKLRMEGDNVLNEYSTYGDYDDYDDFM